MGHLAASDMAWGVAKLFGLQGQRSQVERGSWPRAFLLLGLEAWHALRAHKQSWTVGALYSPWHLAGPSVVWTQIESRSLFGVRCESSAWFYYTQQASGSRCSTWANASLWSGAGSCSGTPCALEASVQSWCGGKVAGLGFSIWRTSTALQILRLACRVTVR